MGPFVPYLLVDYHLHVWNPGLEENGLFGVKKSFFTKEVGAKEKGMWIKNGTALDLGLFLKYGFLRSSILSLD